MALAGAFDRLDDAELVAAARVGDAVAFAGLVDRYHAPLLRFLVRLTGNRPLAEDLAQESFVAAYQHLRQLADDRSFEAWLYQIARNQWRSAYRRQRLVRFLSLDWLTETAREQRFGELRTRDDHGERDHIQRALDQLSSTLREAIVLHHLWGFTALEIAQMLNISPAAAQKRVSRADAAFRACYRALTGDSSQ